MLLGSIWVKGEIKKPRLDICDEPALRYVKMMHRGPRCSSKSSHNKLSSAGFYYALTEEPEMHPKEQRKNEVLIRTTK